MPVMKSKTFRIPLSREPKKNDVILLATMTANEVDTYNQSSTYDGSSWTKFSSENGYISEPSYSNGFISFVLNYFQVTPFKATYITVWGDS